MDQRVHLNRKLRFGHQENLTILDQVLALSELTISTDAEQEIASLRSIIGAPDDALNPMTLLDTVRTEQKKN